MLTRRTQRGVSLVELMVGLVVSLIVVSAAGAMYVTTVRGQADALRLARLNQDLRAAMDVMVADLRRAGTWSGAITVVNAGPPVELDFETNPYTADAFDISIQDAGACVLYAYDADGDGVNVVEVGEVFGFRLNGTVLQMVDPGNAPADTTDCDAGTWLGLTSNDTVIVDELSFSTTNSQCLNATQDISWKVDADPSTVAPCAAAAASVTMNGAGVYAAPNANDLMTEVRQIRITLRGRHASDASVASTITELVHVPNNRTFRAP